MHSPASLQLAPALLAGPAPKDDLVDAVTPVVRSQWGALARSAQLALPPARSEFDQFRHQMAAFFAPQSVESAVLGESPKVSRPVRAPKLGVRSSGLAEANVRV